MCAKKMTLQGVGEILLERSSRAKHINLSVKPFKGVRVAVPDGVSFQDAMAFARARAGWLARHVARMAHIEQEVLRRPKSGVVDRKQARGAIVQRLETLAVRHGFTYNRVFVRNQKTRWGSCSHRNNINLNINLVQLPAELMDYTILHELVHTRIKNHGPGFWRELARHIAKPRQLDRELNQYWSLLVDVNP